MTSSVAEMSERNLDDLTNWITLNSTLDDGRDLKESDVEYYFGVVRANLRRPAILTLAENSSL